LNDIFYSKDGQISQSPTGPAMNNFDAMTGSDPMSQLGQMQNSHAYSSYQRQRTMTLAP